MSIFFLKYTALTKVKTSQVFWTNQHRRQVLKLPLLFQFALILRFRMILILVEFNCHFLYLKRFKKEAASSRFDTEANLSKIPS